MISFEFNCENLIKHCIKWDDFTPLYALLDITEKHIKEGIEQAIKTGDYSVGGTFVANNVNRW